VADVEREVETGRRRSKALTCRCVTRQGATRTRPPRGCRSWLYLDECPVGWKDRGGSQVLVSPTTMGDYRLCLSRTGRMEIDDLDLQIARIVRETLQVRLLWQNKNQRRGFNGLAQAHPWTARGLEDHWDSARPAAFLEAVEPRGKRLGAYWECFRLLLSEYCRVLRGCPPWPQGAVLQIWPLGPRRMRAVASVQSRPSVCCPSRVLLACACRYGRNSSRWSVGSARRTRRACPSP
jgi:hypothetical protein